MVQPRDSVARDIDHVLRAAFLVAQRLSLIENALWQNAPASVPAPILAPVQEPMAEAEALIELDRSAAASGHKLFQYGSGLKCALCGTWKHRSRMSRWAAHKCAAVKSDGSSPARKRTRMRAEASAPAGLWRSTAQCSQRESVGPEPLWRGKAVEMT